MAKNLMTNDTYDARAAVLRHSTVLIESTRRCMSRIIPGNRPLRAYIHRSPPRIEDDLQSKVPQITNNDTFVFGRDHNLEQRGVQRLLIRHGGKNYNAV